MSAKCYVVINIVDITSHMINESRNSETSFRKNLDGTKAILKFKNKYPNSMYTYKKRTHKEILTYLKNNAIEWEANP